MSARYRLHVVIMRLWGPAAPSERMAHKEKYFSKFRMPITKNADVMSAFFVLTLKEFIEADYQEAGWPISNAPLLNGAGGPKNYQFY